MLVGPDMAACSHMRSFHVNAKGEAAAQVNTAQRPRKRSRQHRAVAPAHAPCSSGSTLSQVRLCQRCQARQRVLRLGLCAGRYEGAAHHVPPADLIMLFHPGLAARQEQAIETECLWTRNDGRPGDAHAHGSARGRAHRKARASPQAHCGGGMRSLARAWQPALRRLQESPAPVFCTAFSFTEAQDEVPVLRGLSAASMQARKLVPPERNAFASLVPRAMPVPARAGAMCSGESPLWREFETGAPDLCRVLELENDWLHVNKVVFGMVPVSHTA